MAQNVERGADFARAIRTESRAVDPRLVLRSSYRLDPRKQISALLRQQPSALLLIEKHNRPCRQTLPFGRRNGCCGVRASQGRRILAFKLGVQPPVVQDHEAKAVRLRISRLPVQLLLLPQADCSANIRCRKTCGATPAGGYLRDSRSCQSRSNDLTQQAWPGTGLPGRTTAGHRSAALVCAARMVGVGADGVLASCRLGRHADTWKD